MSGRLCFGEILQGGGGIFYEGNVRGVRGGCPNLRTGLQASFIRV